MNKRKNALGVDIGSVAVSVAILDENKRILRTAYAFHKGQPAGCLSDILQGIDLSGIKSVGYTSSTPKILKYGTQSDSTVAYITAARMLHPDLQALLIIGAEKFGLVTFTENGRYQSFRSNTSCAAGTGSFLDQQAERLNFENIRDFSELALKNQGEIPLIATRCAVFAKTDLIHAQQEGFSTEAICDGLCFGLANNIVDSVFSDQVVGTLIIAGGVALNKAVLKHIQSLISIPVFSDEYAHHYGAIGAALNCSQEIDFIEETGIHGIQDLITDELKVKKTYYPPLELTLSTYPEFDSECRYQFQSSHYPLMKPVEIDLYFFPEKNSPLPVFLGIDIGSTSTKAVLMNQNKEVVAGLYTRTSGQPLRAAQIIFEAIRDLEKKFQLFFEVKGAGTTGSGRKLAGKIIGADLILDEISTHARAAYELNPETDTIIEIGGQDSKFTLMQNGMVTFSVMNNVCAAGTGSFIEEQARKLGVPLSAYAQLTENAKAPQTSDRCTVFMERDLNHYLNEGYKTEEILASVLHSIRDNYLSKLTVKGQIGTKISFQGATARNKSLIAAFEQKLQKPIIVSKFCHLTGALGTALELADMTRGSTKFRGLDIYKKEIPVRSETCPLCLNNCKLKIAEIDNETEAYGFLCGRDYNVKKYVRNSPFSFNLLNKRNGIFRFKPESVETTCTIGIPAGLHLFEDIPFWRKFFDLLSLKTITSEDCPSPVKAGKNLSRAEFCAPVSAMYGHVDYLLDKADYIFLPVYLEETHSSRNKKQYCYYTQFVTSVISVHKHFPRNRILTPLLRSKQGSLQEHLELYRMFKTMEKVDFSLLQIVTAYEKAAKYSQSLRNKWLTLYRNEMKTSSGFHIILLGRPYTVLSKTMNNNIPEIIEKNGVPTYFMDMLHYEKGDISRSDSFANTIRWKFASEILHTAHAISRSENCYPVLITSFKCSPDSFATEYFKEIFQSRQKPYLILQLDEHDSAVGYETRIEAAIRSFRNHYEKEKETRLSALDEISNIHVPGILKSPANRLEKGLRTLVDETYEILQSHGLQFDKFSHLIHQIKIPRTGFSFQLLSEPEKLRNKTLLLPSWDPLVGPLLEAILQNNGYDARLVASTPESIQRSLSLNTGQCLPLNIIVQDAIEHIESHNLNPAESILWLVKSDLSCNLSMFPQFAKKMFINYGKGLENTSVYLGDAKFSDLSLTIAIHAYLAYMFGGYIRKMACQTRPFEVVKGTTEQVTAMVLADLVDVFRTGKPKDKALLKINQAFDTIDIVKFNRPKAAVFGDFYVRDNDLMNQDLIKTVEENGGEVITTPYSEYLKIVADNVIERRLREGQYLEYVKFKFLKSLVPLVEEKYNGKLIKVTGNTHKKESENLKTWLGDFGLHLLHSGESLENILKIHSLIHYYPDISLFIQTNPSYCCPSLVTEAMTARIEEMTGIPVVTIEYDGTSGRKNDVIIPYLKYWKQSKVFSASDL
jgi:predicted CoA-substrate-specific enzyme activase